MDALNSCRNGQIPNAVTNESPIGVFWLIPETEIRKTQQIQQIQNAKKAASLERFLFSEKNVMLVTFHFSFKRILEKPIFFLFDDRFCFHSVR